VVVAATCSIHVIRPFAKHLLRSGLDAEAWLRRHDLALAALSDRDLRVPHAAAMALLEEAGALTGDPAIGVRAALGEEPGDFDVLEYAAANCATLGDALRLAARFIALMHDGVTMEIDVAPPLAAMRVRVAPGLAYVPAAIEFLFASLLFNAWRFIGRKPRPLRVELAHPAPKDFAIYEEYFREAHFGAGEYAMWLVQAALELPHHAADRALLQILNSHADGLLKQLPAQPQSFAERARAAIADELSGGNPGAEQIAARLAVSLRTLHRRLTEEATSHRELVEEVRRAQAMLHLAGTRFSIGEISFLLGFSHPNAFYKAFKRWSGTTPALYREEAHARLPVPGRTG
jgi:AraC-like DNA-binding protein